MFGLAANYMQVLQAEELRGVWDVSSEHSK